MAFAAFVIGLLYCFGAHPATTGESLLGDSDSHFLHTRPRIITLLEMPARAEKRFAGELRLLGTSGDLRPPTTHFSLVLGDCFSFYVFGT